MFGRQFPWLRTRTPNGRRTGRSSTVTFAAIVVAWWLGLGAIVVTLLPPSVASAPRSTYRPLSGEAAHIHGIGLEALPIPVTRLAFDEFNRGTAESDDAAIDAAFEESEWIEVADRNAVQILVVDGEAVQIELLDDSYAHRTGWVKSRHLGP